MNRHRLRLLILRLYATVMLWVVGRALVAASRVDDTVRCEFAPLPKGYQIQMLALPMGPGFVVECQGDGTLVRAKTAKALPDLRIGFKHIAHACLLLGFQEGTAQAFAHDRMVVQGDVSHAVRVVRALNTLESLILPRWLAQRAVKRYPQLGAREKTVKAARIYALFAKNLLLFR